jgi:hypothetical protein
MTHRDVIASEENIKNLDPVIGKFSKRVMIASILILIIGAVISLFLSILRFPMAALAIFCYVFGIFIGLISAEALLRKLMEVKA